VVDWDKRLAREEPFFRQVFQEAGVASVVDLGCGTGKHAIAFSGWGLRVIGVDPSEAMLAQAEKNAAGSGAPVEFLLGGFGDLAGLVPEPVDAVVCLGNALQHVEGVAGLVPAAEDMRDVLRPGGVLVLHYLNHGRLLAGRVRMLPPAFRETDEGEKVFLKVLGYPGGDEITFDLITVERDDAGEWTSSSRSSAHTALPVPDAVEVLERVGFEGVRALGSHAGAEFDEAADESAIIVATRT
jgi:SAM-dependent methyltransferase